MPPYVWVSITLLAVLMCGLSWRAISGRLDASAPAAQSTGAPKHKPGAVPPGPDSQAADLLSATEPEPQGATLGATSAISTEESAESGADIAVGGAPEAEAEAEAEQQGEFYEPTLPLLANPTHPIPADYSPEIVALGNGYELESKAARAWDAMTQAATRDGVSIWVISAYRSHEKQVRNFNSKMQEYTNQGYSEQEAYNRTAAYIAVPGTSEHSMGLAIDFCSLEESFETTKAFRWLFEHCAEYGFILRYPKDKESITKISYEPWHYRYVGTNHAQKIMEQKICLEEYLGILD